jgi:hypothetical protein
MTRFESYLISDSRIRANYSEKDLILMIPTPIVLSDPSGSVGIPAYIWILLLGVIVLQVVAFVRRRRQ